jgi:hypothetical protein
MVDDSELDYLHTWLEAVTTNLAVDTWETKRRVGLMSGDKKALIYPPEILWVNGSFYKKRYKITISMENEANMMSIINEIIEGIRAYNELRTNAIASMCNLELAYSNKAFVEANGRWNQDFWLDVEWITT